eukprot:6792933-Heterocapsa_arctica.AAC.1
MKNNAIVDHSSHFEHEIDTAGVKNIVGIKMENYKLQMDCFVFPDGHGVVILASGRLMNLSYTMNYPSFVISFSFMNQMLCELDLLNNWKTTMMYKNDVSSSRSTQGSAPKRF